MKISKYIIASWGIIIISFIVTALFYPQLPERIATHWGIFGQVNGYMPKLQGLFFLPILSVFLLVLMIFIPRIDPEKENIEKFRVYFEQFILILFLFLFYLHLITIFWNLGYRFNMMQVLSPAFAILIYFTGVMIEKAQPNWFIGIRTPWTLSSGNSWRKTHALGGKLFKASGAIILLGILFPNFSILFILIPLLLTSFTTLIYSYIVYIHDKK